MGRFRSMIQTLGLSGGLGILIVAADVAAAGQQDGVSTVPEPSDLALFALGVAGLMIGRWGSRNHKRRD